MPPIDRLVIFGLATLLVMAPMAIGGVNRGAVVAAEVVIFALATIWLVRNALGRSPADSNLVLLRKARHLALPLIAMAVLLSAQLVPMPPQILRVLSPMAYQVHQVAFPGWPYDKQYSALPGRSVAGVSGSVSPLDSTTSLKGQARRLSNELAVTRTAAAVTINPLNTRRWRQLTLSPAVTSASLVEWLALAAVFFLVLLYPFTDGHRRSGEMQFIRGMTYLIVSTAAVVALVGIAERAWWNGKILWFYQPADWAGPLLVDAPRASGPFVNPDHFANYLAMALPIAVTGTLFPFSILMSRERPTARLLFGAAALLMLAAAALSLSRGGWMAICVGITLTLAMSFHFAPEYGPAAVQRVGAGAVPLSLLTVALMAGLTFYIIGRPGRGAVGVRLMTTSSNDFSLRIGAWRHTLTMIRDFPLFGVGAGAWPEIFPHYQPPPESRYHFFRTAENDYVQLVAEDGLVGLIIVVVVVALTIRAIVANAPAMPAARWPLLAGLLGGLGAGLVQEFVDSSFRLLANALLFTLLLALLLRAAFAEPIGGALPGIEAVAHYHSRLRWLLPIAPAILIVAVWKQDGRTYPYMAEHPSELRMAAQNHVEHPAMSSVHLTLARMMPDASEAQRKELSAAVWLDPNEPLARDLLARNLLMAGRRADALGELSTSVYRAPYLDVHYYLAPQAILWLLPQEQAAIARGFNRAIDDDFGDAGGELASFYLRLGRYQDAAEAYEHAAHATSDKLRRADFLLKAGAQYAL
jgi:hypothetical protein